MFFWNSFAFSMIQRMLAIWPLVPLPFLKPAWTSVSSWFTYCWSLAWRILSEGIVTTYCKLLGSYAAMFMLKVIVLIHCYWSRGVTGGWGRKERLWSQFSVWKQRNWMVLMHFWVSLTPRFLNEEKKIFQLKICSQVNDKGDR